MKQILSKVGRFAPIITLFALLVFFCLFIDGFVEARTIRSNALNLLSQNSSLAIMAVGVTFVLLCAEIDLSIAAMAMLSGVIAAKLFVITQNSVPGAQFIAILAAVAACAVLGYVSGFGTANIGLPSFMMTLSMMLIAEGLALKFTRGEPIFEIPGVLESAGTNSLEFFQRVDAGGRSYALLSIPVVSIVAVVFLLVGFVVLRYTRFGRYVYMVGGNRQAAELAGINVRGVTAACLCLCGFTAGVAGVIEMGRMGSAQATGLEDMLINCIAAVVLGGTSLFGGKGGIGNTIIGLLTFGVLNIGLNQADIDIYSKQFIRGVILMGALVLNVTMARIRSRE